MYSGFQWGKKNLNCYKRRMPPPPNAAVTSMYVLALWIFKNLRIAFWAAKKAKMFPDIETVTIDNMQKNREKKSGLGQRQKGVGMRYYPSWRAMNEEDGSCQKGGNRRKHS